MTKADVKAAVEEAMSGYCYRTKHEAHSWEDYEVGAQSLPLQKANAKNANENADKDSGWTYVTTVYNADPAVFALRKWNLNRLGGLFDGGHSDASDDERSK